MTAPDVSAALVAIQVEKEQDEQLRALSDQATPGDWYGKTGRSAELRLIVAMSPERVLSFLAGREAVRTDDTAILREHTPIRRVACESVARVLARRCPSTDPT